MRRVLVRYEDDEAEDNRVTLSLAGLAVALLVVVASLFIIHTLAQKARVEDCLLAGRFNCDAVLADVR